MPHTGVFLAPSLNFDLRGAAPKSWREKPLTSLVLRAI